jgi:(p)ppGpp synthase/HD superfamily hydrolase
VKIFCPGACIVWGFLLFWSLDKQTGGFMDIVEKALYFAMAAHTAVGQKRKYTGEDYIVHTIEVSNILREAGYANAEMHAAALLHDVVEDTQVTLELIEKEFGKCVATLVEGLTDVSKLEDGNRAVRKEIDRQHTVKQSGACKTIKLADLISNSKSILQHDRDFAKVYLKEKKLLLEVLKEGDSVLWEEANRIVEDGLKELEND